MLELLRTEQGYCDECHQAEVIGVFRIKGWNHVADLCAGCLAILSREIEKNVAWREGHS